PESIMAFPTGPAAVVVTFTGPAVVHLAVPMSITTFHNGLAAAAAMSTTSFHSPVAERILAGATIKSPAAGAIKNPAAVTIRNLARPITATGITITPGGTIR